MTFRGQGGGEQQRSFSAWKARTAAPVPLLPSSSSGVVPTQPVRLGEDLDWACPALGDFEGAHASHSPSLRT